MSLVKILIKAAISSLIISSIIYTVIFIVHTAFISHIKADKIKKSGKYKTVEAKLNDFCIYENGQNAFNGTYDYIVEGKKYSTVISRDRITFFPRSITLYYVKDPKKAVEDFCELGKLQNNKKNIFRLWIVLTVLYFIVLLIAN